MHAGRDADQACKSAEAAATLGSTTLAVQHTGAAAGGTDLIKRGDVQDVLDGVLALEGYKRADLQLIICITDFLD